MAFPVEKFLSSLPASWKSVHEVLKKHHLVPTLVGGTVRDYLLTGYIGKDWDIEITHPTLSFNKDYWKDLLASFKQIGNASFLPYEVIRLEIGPHQYEFSPPRVEAFTKESGHKNFSAEFNFKLPFEKSLLRRDFTINAIGLRFENNNVSLLDPLGALVHLNQKILYPCSPDFTHDPVRFLRAIRFSLKLGFTLSPELEQIMLKMSVSYSPAYLWTEMQKSHHPIAFLNELLLWQERRHDIVLPVDADFASRMEELKKILIDPTKQDTWALALAWTGLSSDKWQKYFSMSSESTRRLTRWAESSKTFSSISPDIYHGEFEVVSILPEFAILFDWYFTTKQLLQKNPTLPLLQMIEEFLPEWIYLYRFESVKDVKHIDPPLRAKYQLWNLCQRL